MGDQAQYEVDTIGARLMNHEFVALELANPECDMCVWLERGYQTCDSLNEIEAYASEILLHRRAFHIATADHIN